jgi:FkbM family methyltransferase
VTSSLSIARGLRRAASQAKRHWFPTPEVAAWRHACRVAAEAPRYTPGEIAFGPYTIAYADLLTLCPQWHDIFVNEVLRFEPAVERPRILDCGANVGLASLYFKRRHPHARITAYEADPALAALCRRNLAANGAEDVQVEAAAVWTTTGVVAFEREGADSGAIAGTSAGLQGEPVTVPSIRLRDVLERERVDLLKLDIEGAERHVLADCADALGGVQAIVLDLHEFETRARQTPDVLRLLESAGFAVSMSDLSPLPWRARGADASPFPGDSPAWAVTVRGWRRS